MLAYLTRRLLDRTPVSPPLGTLGTPWSGLATHGRRTQGCLLLLLLLLECVGGAGRGVHWLAIAVLLAVLLVND